MIERPRRRARIVPVILFFNVAVFILWHLFPPESSTFMEENFLVSWQSLMEGRFWTLLTAVFSHSLFLHFFFNMYVLMSFGSLLEVMIGPRSFVVLYFSAGIFSSGCHALVSAALLNQPELPALGASGAIAGIILVFSLLFPKEKILLFGLIPLPAIWGAVVFVGLDVWGLIAQAEGGGLPIGHGAHLGGALVGIIYYFQFLRRRFRPNLDRPSRIP